MFSRATPRIAYCIIFCMFSALLKAQQTPDAASPATPAPSAETQTTAAGASHWTTGNIAAIAIPSAMVLYGALSVGSDTCQKWDYNTRNELAEDGHNTHNHIDNYAQFAPAAATFILKATGVESRHKTSDMIALFALSTTVESGVVFATKSITKRERPNGSDRSSFPSGHTATAFVGAEFLNQEYGYKSPWISVGGYAVASAVGASRVLNNKHWVSDVVAGAGIGILCTKGVYWLYLSLKEKLTSKTNKSQTFILPDYSNGTFNLKLTHSF